MRAIGMLFLASVLLLDLAACKSDGTPTPQAEQTITVACKVDEAAPAAVQAGGQIAATIDPAIAPEVALASAIDLLVHPLVQAACPGTGVASVTTVAKPVAPISP